MQRQRNHVRRRCKVAPHIPVDISITFILNMSFIWNCINARQYWACCRYSLYVLNKHVSLHADLVHADKWALSLNNPKAKYCAILRIPCIANFYRRRLLLALRWMVWLFAALNAIIKDFNLIMYSCTQHIAVVIVVVESLSQKHSFVRKFIVK